MLQKSGVREYRQKVRVILELQKEGVQRDLQKTCVEKRTKSWGDRDISEDVSQ